MSLDLSYHLAQFQVVITERLE